MAIMPSLTLLRMRRILAPSYIEKWSRRTSKNSTRLGSTESGSKILEHLTNRSLIRVSGNESFDFLQGLITNDMGRFDEGSSNIYALFLNTKGRVMCESIIYGTVEKSIYYIECDARIADNLEKHLKMYKVRRKVVIESLKNAMKVWSMFDPSLGTCENNENYESTKRAIEGQIFPCPASSGDVFAKLTDDIMLYDDPRIPELGMRILSGPSVTRDEIFKHSARDIPTSDDSLNYRKFRYRLGIAEGIDDLPIGKALPLEINCDYLRGVSFRKGCYIGQELTARTHHTGVVRKRLMPFIMKNCDGNVFNYDDSMIDERGKVVGKFRGHEGIFGLGLVRIAEALNARTINISDCRVSVTKPRWWPKESYEEKAAVDTGK